MFGLTWNEAAFVAFLFVLITAARWLPSVGQWLGEFVAGLRQGARPPPQGAHDQSARPSTKGE